MKVQRPGAPRQIEADLALLYQAARLVKERVRALDFIDARALIDEFARADPAGARLPARGAQRADVPPQLRGESARARAEGVLAVHARARADARVARRARTSPTSTSTPLTLDERRDLAYLIAETWMEMIFRHGFFHGDPHPANILVLRRGGDDRARRLRRRREAHRRRHVEADAAVHRRRGGERRRAAEAARRSRRALPEGARGGVPRRDPRDVLPLLRREPRGDRSDPGDPRGVPAHLLDEPAAADALSAARPRDRDASVRSASSSIRTSTCSRSRGRTRAG